MKVKVSQVIDTDVETIETDDYRMFLSENCIFVEHLSGNFELRIGKNWIAMDIVAKRPGHDHNNELSIVVKNVVDNCYPDISLHEREENPVLIRVWGHPAGKTWLKIDEYGSVKILKGEEKDE